MYVVSGICDVVVVVVVVVVVILFFALAVIPGPPLFSLTTQLRNPFPCPVTFVTGLRLLKQSFPDSASRICTVGSKTRSSSRPLRLELATEIVLRVFNR